MLDCFHSYLFQTWQRSTSVPLSHDILEIHFWHPLYLFRQESVESSLQIIHDISTENIGTLCISKLYSPLKIPLTTERYDGARQKSDLASVVLQDLGFNRHSGKSFINAIKSFSFNQQTAGSYALLIDIKTFPTTLPFHEMNCVMIRISFSTNRCAPPHLLISSKSKKNANRKVFLPLTFYHFTWSGYRSLLDF